VIATCPTRSADGAVDLAVDTATVLGVELCLPGSGGDVTSRDAMSSLQEAGGNAHWLLSQCLRCIADESARRTSDPRAARRRPHECLSSRQMASSVYRRRIDPQDIEIATRLCDPTYRRSASSAGSSLTLAKGNSPPRGVKITEHSTIMGVF
jgi:hypothetical protein